MSAWTRPTDPSRAGKHPPLSSPSATFNQTTVDLGLISSSLDAASLSDGAMASIIAAAAIVVVAVGCFGEFPTSFLCLSERSYTFFLNTFKITFITELY